MPSLHKCRFFFSLFFLAIWHLFYLARKLTSKLLCVYNACKPLISDEFFFPYHFDRIHSLLSWSYSSRVGCSCSHTSPPSLTWRGSSWSCSPPSLVASVGPSRKSSCRKQSWVSNWGVGGALPYPVLPAH